MIERSLAHLLTTDTPVAAFVADRVYPLRVPQGGSLPCVVLTRASTPRVSHLLGPSKLAHPRIQADCLANVFADAEDLGDAVRLLLDGYRGTADGRVIQGCHLADEEHTEEPPRAADDLPVFRVRLDFDVWYEET